MAWNSFTCDNPDFAVRSTLDGTIFRVQQSALNNCEVFRDMLLCCEQKDHGPDEVLDLHESVQVLSALLHLLHYPLSPPVEAEIPPLKGDSGSAKFDRERLLPRIPSYEHTSVIPLPVLQPMLFDLVDKYGLNVDIFSVLCAHLLAHAPAHPLRVYGFAASFEPRYHWRRSPTGPAAGEGTRNSASDKFGIGAEKEMEEQMQKVASKAIQFLEPIGSYSMENVLDAIPSVKALHRVVQLQHLRLRALRVVLDESEIFPKGYGACPSHCEKTTECWDRQRKALSGKIDSGTDVAGEMALFVDTLKPCHTCYKAGVAAVEMLAYKCYRAPKQAQLYAGLA